MNITLPRTLVTAPVLEPITIEELKKHAIIELDDDDEYINSLIIAAREYVEDYTNKALITQTWDLFSDNFPEVLYLPLSPLQSITSISYVDTGGATQTVATSIYTVDTDSVPGRVYLAYQQSWPSIRTIRNAITVRFVAGYGSNESDVPRKIRLAMYQLISHWYENREATINMSINTVPFTVTALLSSERIRSFA